MNFYLGTHRPHWLARDEFAEVPLFVSRRTLLPRGKRSFIDRPRLPEATGRWVMDSGGYTELAGSGEWSITVEEYAREVERARAEIGGLDWVAPMDWMAEPNVRALTGKTVEEHQILTVENFRRLRDLVGPIVAPVLQGWETDDYGRCIDLYDLAGVDLAAEPVVGVGSICRRHADRAILDVLRSLEPYGLRLHGFGIRGSVLAEAVEVLASADSMAWSFDARRNRPALPGCTHKRCSNCSRYALAWRSNLLVPVLDQLRLEVSA